MSAAGPFALGAALLAGLAAAVAQLDGDSDIVPFFVALTLGGGLQAWAAGRGSRTRGHRAIVVGVAVAWLIAAVWVGALLAWHRLLCGCSMPPPSPELTYLGLTATLYHVAGLFGGLLLVLIEAARTRRRG